MFKKNYNTSFEWTFARKFLLSKASFQFFFIFSLLFYSLVNFNSFDIMCVFLSFSPFLISSRSFSALSWNLFNHILTYIYPSFAEEEHLFHSLFFSYILEYTLPILYITKTTVTLYMQKRFSHTHLYVDCCFLYIVLYFPSKPMPPSTDLNIYTFYVVSAQSINCKTTGLINASIG